MQIKAAEDRREKKSWSGRRPHAYVPHNDRTLR